MRQPHPWYSETRSGGGWFVKLSGEQHFLGKRPAGAAKPVKRTGRWNPPNEILSEYHKLMAVRDMASRADDTFDNICALYLAELEAVHPESWAKQYPSDQTQRTCITFCKAVMEWAVKKNINVHQNPFAEAKVPIRNEPGPGDRLRRAVRGCQEIRRVGGGSRLANRVRGQHSFSEATADRGIPMGPVLCMGHSGEG